MSKNAWWRLWCHFVGLSNAMFFVAAMTDPDASWWRPIASFLAMLLTAASMPKNPGKSGKSHK